MITSELRTIGMYWKLGIYLSKMIWIMILLLTVFSPVSIGQQSILLSFSSLSTIDSVRIENLSTGSYTVTNDNNLEIIFESPSQLDPVNIRNATNTYPNPFAHNTNFEIYSAKSGTIDIRVFDLSGSQVASITQEIEQGCHQFIFSPNQPGIYLLNARHVFGASNSRLICMQANSSCSSIEYNGPVQQTNTRNRAISVAKKSIDNFTAEIGDLLKLTAYSAGSIDTKYDFLYSDQLYDFCFDHKHYAFKKYFFKEKLPGLIEMVFSVSDSTYKGVDYLSSEDFIVKDENVLISPGTSFQYIMKKPEIPTLIRTVLLLDNSSKIESELDSLKKSAKEFVQSMVENQEMAIYIYSDSAFLLSDFTNRTILLEYWIDKIKPGSASSNLQNSLSTPLNKWQDQYTPSHIMQGALVVFSSRSDDHESDLFEDIISNKGEKRIYSISMDSEVDSVLAKLSIPGQYYQIRDFSELNAAFASVQSDIVRFSNSIYYLNYMSEKRDGEHTVEVSIANNENTDISAYLTDSYSAEGFSSSTPGVYLNTSDSVVYGIDTLWCSTDRTAFAFSYDGSAGKVQAIDTLVLNPVSYGASQAPSYAWEMNRNEAFKIESLPLVEAVLLPTSMARDTVIITLSDKANKFSKNIVYIMEPPEFFENMGIPLAEIKDSRLREISGIAASIKYPGYFWVHNDSGDDANVFLIDTAGYTRATVSIDDITSRDWEDIALGPGPVDGESYIYIADIGDLDKEHTYKYVYRIPEPEVDTSVVHEYVNIQRDKVAGFTFKYADGPRDAEILLLDPNTKDLYVVTKRETHVQIYTLPYPQNETDTLILTKSEVTLPFRMTNGGDISADGNEILIKNLTTVYYWKRETGETIIETLSRKAMSLPYIQEPQGEAIAWFRDGSGYITVSERKDSITPVLYLYKR